MDKEEKALSQRLVADGMFFARLDRRLALLSGMLSQHEKVIYSLCPKADYEKAVKAIEEHHSKLFDWLDDSDKSLVEKYSKMFEEVENEAK